MASRARDEERRGGRTGEGEGAGARGRFAGEGREDASDKIHLFPSFFFPPPRRRRRDSRDLVPIPPNLIENSRKILRIIGPSPCHRRASLYLYVHGYILRYPERKGERETGSEGDGSTYIHVGGGEERRDENKGGGKKRGAKFAFGIASGPCLTIVSLHREERARSSTNLGGDERGRGRPPLVRISLQCRRGTATEQTNNTPLRVRCRRAGTILLRPSPLPPLLVRASSAIKRASELKVR